MVKENSIHRTTTSSFPKDILTSLPDGSKILKSDLRMDACGTIDELNSFIGLLISVSSSEYNNDLISIQRKLFSVGAFLADKSLSATLPSNIDVQFLIDMIKTIQNSIIMPKSFILPGGCREASLAHVCRTVCRRAERIAVALQAYDVVPYLNKLSTFLFYFALYLNSIHNVDEIKL